MEIAYLGIRWQDNMVQGKKVGKHTSPQPWGAGGVVRNLDSVEAARVCDCELWEQASVVSVVSRGIPSPSFRYTSGFWSQKI